VYDFYCLGQEQLGDDLSDYLIFVKRTLPRWVNSIPDNEYLAIFEQARATLRSGDAIVETGCGASSLALVCAAIKTGAMLYSWDLNGSKLEFMRNVAFQTLGRVLGADINKYWHSINYNSTDNHLGIEVIREQHRQIGLAFLDSYHTLDHVMQELRITAGNLRKGASIIIDDAYYTNKSVNYSYINIMRKKLGLPEVAEPAVNRTEPYWQHVEKFLRTKFDPVSMVDSGETDYRDDTFFAYYDLDRKAINHLGMEDRDQLHNRFKIWVVGDPIHKEPAGPD